VGSLANQFLHFLLAGIFRAAGAAEPASGDAPTHPLDRLAGGGWAAGLLRLALGVGIVVALLLLAGKKALDPLLRTDRLGHLALGALLILGERTLRIVKWHAILQRLPLVPRPPGFLLRIQFIGLLFNQLAPVSELLKAWAVSRTRRDVLLALETMVLDIAALSLVVGAVGAAGAVVLIASDATPWLAVPGVAIAAGSLALVLLIRYRRRNEAARTPGLPLRVWLLSFGETACVLGAYVLGLYAVGVPVPAMFAVAVLPLLYLSQVVMFTPSGLGVREALFAAVLGGLSAAPTETGVAMGLIVSAMYLLVALGAGSVALLLPGGGTAALRRRVDEPRRSAVL
jgi:uncharacterized membrane protein YbhN (UPF0104 family)